MTRGRLCFVCVGIIAGIMALCVAESRNNISGAVAPAAPQSPQGGSAARRPAKLDSISRPAGIEPTTEDTAAELLASFPDVEDALDHVAQSARTSDERFALLTRILPRWTLAAPMAAWTWAKRHAAEWQEAGQPTTTEIVLEALAREKPQAIAALVSGDDGVFLYSAVEALVRAHQVAEAWRVVDNVARDLRLEDDAALTRVASALARESPALTAQWLETLPPSAGREAGLSATAATWARTDGPTALAWAESLPEPSQAAALAAAFSAWSELHSEPALAWLATQAPRPITDRLIAAWLVVAPEIRRQPQLATSWLNLIRDADLRSATSRSLTLTQAASRTGPSRITGPALNR